MGLKLREIRAQPAVERGQPGVLLSDPLNLSEKTLFISGPLVPLLTLMDGTRDVGMLRSGFELRTGTPVSGSLIEQFVAGLDEALFLDNERFTWAYQAALREYRSAASRPPILAGKCYPADAAELDRFLQGYLDEVDKDDLEFPTNIRGLISPHIDFERGGHIYAEVWSKAQAALREAELVIILGTDHNEGGGKITLTRQSYETPWGLVPTAQSIVEEFANKIGPSVFDRELGHRGEHSIEAALIWLHYLLGSRVCQILPILCGSFRPFIEGGESPQTAPHIAATIETLRKVASERRTVIVAAADLAHVGPAFGDPPLDIIGRAGMAKQDNNLIRLMSRGQAEDFFNQISREKDGRHVCGLPPIYIVLRALGEVRGRPLGYDQCPASADGKSLVSVCGIIYQD